MSTVLTALNSSKSSFSADCGISQVRLVQSYKRLLLVMSAPLERPRLPGFLSPPRCPPKAKHPSLSSPAISQPEPYPASQIQRRCTSCLSATVRCRCCWSAWTRSSRSRAAWSDCSKRRSSTRGWTPPASQGKLAPRRKVSSLQLRVQIVCSS